MIHKLLKIHRHQMSTTFSFDFLHTMARGFYYHMIHKGILSDDIVDEYYDGEVLQDFMGISTNNRVWIDIDSKSFLLKEISNDNFNNLNTDDMARWFDDESIQTRRFTIDTLIIE